MFQKISRFARKIYLKNLLRAGPQPAGGRAMLREPKNQLHSPLGITQYFHFRSGDMLLVSLKIEVISSGWSVQELVFAFKHWIPSVLGIRTHVKCNCFYFCDDLRHNLVNISTFLATIILMKVRISVWFPKFRQKITRMNLSEKYFQVYGRI